MGGLFALEYLETRRLDRKFDSVILSSPALRLSKKPLGAKVFFGRIFSYMFPKMAIDNKLDIRGISRDAKVVEDYKKDPLNHAKVSLYTARKIFNLQDKFNAHPKFETESRILLVHGKNDLMTSVDASKEFFDNSLKFESKHKLVCVDSGYHECNQYFMMM
jgi:acylglycerol lipase